MPAPLPTPVPTYRKPRGRSPLRNNLVLFLVSLAIGCMLAGLLVQARRNAASREQQRQQQAAPSASK